MSNETTVAEYQQLWQELEALELAYTTKKICFYKPIGKQAEFHAADVSTVRLVLGSNRSGKSVAGVVEAIAHSLGYRPWLPEGHPNRVVRLANGQPIPVPNIGRVIAQNYQQAVNQTIWPKIQEWAPAGWYTIKKDNRGIPVEVHWKNGSITYFMSDDQDDMAFEGPNGHWVWGDEPFGYRKYTGLKRGLVDFSGHIWMTMTPLSQPWINDIIVNRANDPGSGVKMWKFSIWDNCTERGGHLRREDIEEFLSDLREDELEARLHANFLHLAGRVYKQWDPEEPFWVDPRSIPDSWPRVCIIDPHPRKPVCVVWLAVSPDDQVFVYRDLFNPRLRTIRAVADEIKRLEGWVSNGEDRSGNPSYVRGSETEPVCYRLIDNSAQEDEKTSGSTIRKKFQSYGLYTDLAKKRNKDAGIEAIHDALDRKYEWAEPGLVVFNCCRKVKNDFLNFCWEDWSTDKQQQLKGSKQEVRKNHDDAIDCIRYYYQSGCNYKMLRGHQRRAEANWDQEQDFNGRGMISGSQGPMTRRERQHGRRLARQRTR